MNRFPIPFGPEAEPMADPDLDLQRVEDRLRRFLGRPAELAGAGFPQAQNGGCPDGGKTPLFSNLFRPQPVTAL